MNSSPHDRAVLHTKEASTGHLFSRSQKIGARVANQHGEVDNSSGYDNHDPNNKYRPEKEIFGGSMVPQRSSRMLNKARSIKTFNQNMANINKRRNGGDTRQPEESTPSPQQQEESPPPSPQQHPHPQYDQYHPPPPPPPQQMQFANPAQAAMFEEFQERELNKLREINARQKQLEEEERLIREEQASKRLKDLHIIRDKRLAMEQEEERKREAQRKEDEARKNYERELAKKEAERLEAERVAREEEAQLQELLARQKKEAKKKKLQDEIDKLLDEEDLMEALHEQKQLILGGTLNEVDMARAIERLQNLEQYLHCRQRGIPLPVAVRTEGSRPPPPPPPGSRSGVQMHVNPMATKKYPSAQDIADMSDTVLTRTTDETRNALLDFDTKSEPELMELYQVLTNLESEMAHRHETTGDPKEALAREKRELQYQKQEERNGAEVQRQIDERRAQLESDQREDNEVSDWAKANQLKQEKLQQMRMKEAQLKEARLQKEKELQRAQEMRQRLIDEEYQAEERMIQERQQQQLDEQDYQRQVEEERYQQQEQQRRHDQMESERRMQQRKDEQLLQEQEDLVLKLQHKLDAEEKLRTKQEEYQRAKELKLQQQRDLAERQRLLEKKQRLAEEKRRVQEERAVSEKQREMLEQKKGAALLLQEKETLISQLQGKIDEEEKLKAKRDQLKRAQSLKKQESLKRQDSKGDPYPHLKKQESLKRRDSEKEIIQQLQRKIADEDKLKARQLRKQVSFNSSVEVGIFQKQKPDAPPVHFLSDSDTDSDDGRGGSPHFSFRDGAREVENHNDNPSAYMYKQKRSSLRPDGTRKDAGGQVERERAAELAELYKQKRSSLRPDGSRKNAGGQVEREKDELAELYKQKRSSLRPDGTRKNAGGQVEREKAAELAELYKQKRNSLRPDGGGGKCQVVRDNAATLSNMYKQKRSSFLLNDTQMVENREEGDGESPQSPHFTFRDGAREIENLNDNVSAEMYKQKRNTLRGDAIRNGWGGGQFDKEKQAADLSDLYKQKRSGLRPVNPSQYALRSGFDEDDNTTDRDSLEYKSAKFNFSNIGDESDDYVQKKREKKSSFRAYDNPMAESKSKAPPPPPRRRDNGGGGGGGGGRESRNGGMKAQPSVLARWPPAHTE